MKHLGIHTNTKRKLQTFYGSTGWIGGRLGERDISNPTGDNLRALNEIRVDNALGLSRIEIINNVVTIIP